MFEFQPGTTAISGENGAGKTTIVEAIAWALFDVLDYKKDDFVRRGAKKGSVRVTFESGLDERDYVVYRDTGTGYYIYDPRLKMRLADKKEEVTRFLWQHLALEPGTDLETLFKHAIGVPQGTFTAIFLATAAERKRTFDTLLKVEEYRRGAEELLKTQRFIENRIADMNILIARAEGELERSNALEAERTEVESSLISLKKQSEELEAALGRLNDQAIELDKLAEAADAAQKELAERRSEFEKLELVAKQKEAEFQESQDAAAKIETVRSDAENHKKSLARIAELERERTERDRLRDELFKIEKAEDSVKAEERSVREKLNEIAAAHAQLNELRPLTVKQSEREKKLDEVRARLAVVRVATQELMQIDEKLEKMRVDFSRNKTLLADAREKLAVAKELDRLQRRESEVVSELARARAELDRDQRFQREIKNGLCPILSEKCLNLKNGETLESFIGSQFNELKTHIETLEVESAALAQELAGAREASKAVAQVSVYEERATEIEAEGKRLRTEYERVKEIAAEEPALVEMLTGLESGLKELDNPKAKAELLERQIEAEPDLQQRLSNIEKNLERLESDRKTIVEQTEAYKDWDEHWRQATELRDSTTEGHRTFLSLERIAGETANREIEFHKAHEAKDKAELAVAEAQELAKQASKNYDPAKHQLIKTELLAVQKSVAETTVRLETVQKRAESIRSELTRLAETKARMQAEIDERERQHRTLEATVFIRDTLKEAAPLVARNYVYLVSSEANLMFREVTNNAERTLKWAEDYGIVLEEGGYERPFHSLSGGEQMAAALSVRLALLKQLSDIRIAFFDEPTTNMDAERRENLAQQIGQIRHFDQLFVISHDDTFEGYMDNEIMVEKAV